MSSIVRASLGGWKTIPTFGEALNFLEDFTHGGLRFACSGSSLTRYFRCRKAFQEERRLDTRKTLQVV